MHDFLNGVSDDQTSLLATSAALQQQGLNLRRLSTALSCRLTPADKTSVRTERPSPDWAWKDNTLWRTMELHGHAYVLHFNGGAFFADKLCGLVNAANHSRVVTYGALCLFGSLCSAPHSDKARFFDPQSTPGPPSTRITTCGWRASALRRA